MSIFFSHHKKTTKPTHCAVCGDRIPEGIPFWRVFGEMYCVACHRAMDERAEKEDGPEGDQSVRWFKSA